jgi:hypothetical protein
VQKAHQHDSLKTFIRSDSGFTVRAYSSTIPGAPKVVETQTVFRGTLAFIQAELYNHTNKYIRAIYDSCTHGEISFLGEYKRSYTNLVINSTVVSRAKISAAPQADGEKKVPL